MTLDELNNVLDIVGDIKIYKMAPLDKDGPEYDYMYCSTNHKTIHGIEGMTAAKLQEEFNKRRTSKPIVNNDYNE